MIFWIALLLIGIVLYIKVARNSSHKRDNNRKTLNLFSMAFLTGLLMMVTIFNGNANGALSYFVLGVGTMSIIAIVIEALLSTKRTSSQTE